MITCDECGRENDDEYKFCLGCGAALEEANAGGDEEEAPLINCPYCGAEQPSDFKFCGSCGEQIPVDVADQGGDEPAVESSSDEQRATSPGKPGGDEKNSGGSGQPQPAKAAQSAQAAQSSPGQVGREHSQPGTAAAAGDQGDAPPMPSDVSEDAAQGQTGAGAGGQVVDDAIAELIVIRPDGTEGASIDLPKDTLTLGRASDLDALSGDPFLSPKHAAILYRDSQFIVKDDDSLNGIFREVTDSVALQDGDLVRIGQELLEFEAFADDPHADEGEPLAAGSPDSGHWGRLRLIAGPGVYTEAYALDEEEVTVGRETGDIVFKDDGFVSGTHARLSKKDGNVVLEDLDSSNGTFIRIRDDYPLDDGERVLMGQQLFRLEVA